MEAKAKRKIEEGKKNFRRMHLDSNKKHLRNDILHSIIIKWSMFIRIFFIPSLLIFFHSSNNLFCSFFHSNAFLHTKFSSISLSRELYFAIKQFFVPNCFTRNQRIFRLFLPLLVLSLLCDQTIEPSSIYPQVFNWFIFSDSMFSSNFCN